MAIPKIEFPMTQDQVAPAVQSVLEHIKALETELKLSRALLAETREWCSHPGLGNNASCPCCGKYFSRYDD
jgi:hypothetical protein